MLKAKKRKIYSLHYRDKTKNPELQKIINLANHEGLVCHPSSLPKNLILSKDFKHEPPWIWAKVGKYPYVELSELTLNKKDNSFLLAFDQIQDPQNLGAILRSLYALGGSGAILPKNHSVGITPTVSRVSAGAAEHLKIALVSNLAQTLDNLKKKGYWLIGTSSKARQTLEEIPHPPHVLIFGNEHKGLRKSIEDKLDLSIGVPIRNDFDSLNVSASAAIMIYEILKNN